MGLVVRWKWDIDGAHLLEGSTQHPEDREYQGHRWGTVEKVSRLLGS